MQNIQRSLGKERDKDMPGKKKKVILISVIVIALIVAFIVYRKLNQVDNYHDKYAGSRS